jgi:peptidoglycan/xylan/chitin deacetylase (PgdA/CDA1 family)
MRLVRACIGVLVLSAVLTAAGLALRPDRSVPAARPALAARPAPASPVHLTAGERAVWRPLPVARDRIPVLLYHGIGEPRDFEGADGGYAVTGADFAKQMALLRAGGYQTVTLDQFRRFIAGRPVRLPPRPLLLTFDDSLAGSFDGADAVLRELGWTAVMFVDVGGVDAGAPGRASWDELRAAQRSGRWELQLHAGRGHHNIVYDAHGTTGPFYAYRIQGRESIDAWWRRVIGDLEWGERRLRAELPGYRRLAFAPPYGNLGQLASNDRRIPRRLGRWLRERFGLVFVQEPSHYARVGGVPAPRLQVTRRMAGGEIHAWLERGLGR